ncbi:MAG: murein biosynthesis integral membrane protein MurJ [Chloroflexi bacterium]|nr:murein biosynthesis integral membrane protein MurJ [Chloroflexota bacterium]
MRATRPNLAGAALLLMAAFVASRLTGLLRDIIISGQFGTSAEYEAYLAGNRIPDLLFQVLAGGAVASAFIPVLARYLAQDDREGASDLIWSLMNLSAVVIVPLILLLMVFANPMIGLLTPGWEAGQQSLAANLARVMLVSPLFFTLGCFTTSVLNAHHRFLLPALGPVMYNLGIIAGAVWLADAMPGLGLARGYGLAIGAALGALGFLLALRLGHDGVRQVGRLLLPRALGLGVTQVNFLVVLFFASLVPGGYAALNYAWLLTMLPLGVFAMAISTAVFPTMASQSANEQSAAMRRTLSQSLRAILYLTIPAGVGLIVLGRPLIRLLFERGQFGPAATEATFFALQFYAWALFAHASTEIVARAFYALHDTTTPFLVAAGAMLLNLALCGLLIGPLAHGGLALAVSVAGVVEAATLMTIMERRIAGLVADVAPLALQAGAAALVMGAGLALVGRAAPAPSGFLALTGYVAGLVAGGALIYWATTLALGCAEARRMVGTLARATRRV